MVKTVQATLVLCCNKPGCELQTTVSWSNMMSKRDSQSSVNISFELRYMKKKSKYPNQYFFFSASVDVFVASSLLLLPQPVSVLLFWHFLLYCTFSSSNEDLPILCSTISACLCWFGFSNITPIRTSTRIFLIFLIYIFSVFNIIFHLQGYITCCQFV